MKNFSVLLAFLFAATSVFAQQPEMDLFKDMSVRHIGPAGMSGRVTSIDVVEKDPNVMYVGTASGGLWKSKSGGVTWEPIFEDEPTQSIGSVAVYQSNPSIIWAGTGEGNPRNSHSSGRGIFKSIDGGNSWECMGLEETKIIHRVIIDKTNPQIVYAAAMGSAWGENPERGVYKTTDGGESWEKILYVNESTGCADLVVDPTNPNKLVAAMWEYGRKPWTFNSGGEGSGLYITFDGGKTWKEKTEENGLPKGELGRIGLAISPSDPEIIYALVEAKKTGLYKSVDGGFNWKLVTTENIGNRPFYYADIFIDPENPNRLYNLYSVVSKSEDRGKTWDVLLPYSGVHPDHHAFWIHPNDPDFLIDGNDGGLSISRDGGGTWKFINNLPLGQFYHINHDMDIPYNVYGGMQDNGSWKGPGYVWHYGGIRNEDWQEIMFGDGFDVVPYPADSRYAYAMYQGGNVSWIDTETGASQFVQPNHPQGEELRFNWNAAIAQDPFSDCGVYFGSQFVHYSSDCGSSWEIISPDLTTDDTTKQKQAESGGLTIDATKAENYTTITAIAPSGITQDIIWVGTDDGNVQVTSDGGQNWKNCTGSMKDFPEGAWINQIVTSKVHKGEAFEREAFVVAIDYMRNNWEPLVYHTKDLGKSWKRIATPEQIDYPTWSIAQDNEEESLLFLGTEGGLFVSFDYGNNWQLWEHEIPSVAVRDLKIHPRESDLIVGTFGRAAYIIDDITPLRKFASNERFNKSGFTILSAPDAYLASYMRPAGERFNADFHFAGENKSSGANFSVFVPRSDEEKVEEKDKSDDAEEGEEEEGKDEIDVKIIDQAGDTLRNFQTKADTAVMRVRWGLDRKGVRWPSREDRKDEDKEPGGGLQVAPGKYFVVMEYKGEKDSTMLTVHADPRLDFSPEAHRERETAVKRLYETVELADAGFERLKEARKTIELVQSNLKTADDTIAQALIDSSKTLIKKLDSLETQYMNPRGFDGYDHVTQRLNNLLYNAHSYINSDEKAPGENAMNALRRAENETEEVISQVNEFFTNEWKVWREKVENYQLSLFKDYEPLER